MKNVELTKQVIPKDVMARLDPKQLKRLIMFTFMMRDLNILQKYLIYTHNDVAKSEPETAAMNTTIFFLLKTLLSKIHEMWVFSEKNGIFKELENSSGNLAIQYKSVINFYSDDKIKNIFAFIRDKFGFHYEYQNDIDDMISNTLKQFDYEAWLSTNDSGNEIFSSSTVVGLHVIYGEMRKLGYQGEDSELISLLFELSLKAAKIFREFCLLYITDGLSLPWQDLGNMAIEVPEIIEIKLPLIVAR